MGNKDKVEMEDAIRERLKINRNTRIICRKGDPVSINDLKIVNLAESKSIIIVGDTDSKVIKTILAINNSQKESRSIPYNIVAVLRDGKNTDSGKIAGQGQASFILNSCFIARLIAHTCYQPGLSLVYNELLRFKGNDIYTRNFKGLSGISFNEAKFMFENSSLIGINDGSTVTLNPAGDTIIKDNDEVVLIRRDDEAFISPKKQDHDVDLEKVNISGKTEEGMEKILILGWNMKAKMIIDELIKYVSPKTEVTIVAETDPQDEFELHKNEEDAIIINGIKIDFVQGDINDYDLLAKLSAGGFDHVLVLAYTDKELQEADSITLMTLIHLRDIAEKNGMDFSITSEMLDISNRDLVKVAKVNDFIVSEKLTSLLLAQISENKLLDPIFEDLLCEAGSEIYLKKVKDFVRIDEPVDFYTILEATAQKNELAIGYKIKSEEDREDKNFGICINPVKSKPVKFTKEDTLIVLAEGP
jgi:voltage-gated potassium channel Kch